MAGDEGIANWIAEKLRGDQFSAVNSIGSGYIEIARKDGSSFIAAAIGVQDIVMSNHVTPLFSAGKKRPEFVVNVPSKAIWSGPAIEFIHDAPAAFGALGELIKAARGKSVSTYRHREYDFAHFVSTLR